MSGVPVTDITLSGALGRGLVGELDYAFVQSLEMLLRCAFFPIFPVRKTLRSCIKGEHLTHSPLEFLVDKKLLDEGTPGARQLKDFFPDLVISEEAARFTVNRCDLMKESQLRFNVPVVVHRLVFKDQPLLLFPEQIAVGPNSFDLLLHIPNLISSWLEEEDSILPSNINSAPEHEAVEGLQGGVSRGRAHTLRLKNKKGVEIA